MAEVGHLHVLVSLALANNFVTVLFLYFYIWSEIRCHNDQICISFL